MVTWLRNPSAAKIFVINEGRDPFNQNFRTFRSKTQWIGSVQPEKFRKNGSTFWGGLLFPVGPVGILVEWIAPEISVSLQKKSPNWMSFSSLNRTKCVSHQGICISNESFFFFFFFYRATRWGGAGNLSLGITFWLPPTLGLSNVQIDRTAKYALQAILIFWTLFYPFISNQFLVMTILASYMVHF